MSKFFRLKVNVPGIKIVGDVFYVIIIVYAGIPIQFMGKPR
jgi:hypothetical protein